MALMILFFIVVLALMAWLIYLYIRRTRALIEERELRQSLTKRYEPLMQAEALNKPVKGNQDVSQNKDKPSTKRKGGK